MTKAETAILEAKTPAEYIEAALKSRLSPAAKARLARPWMAKTGYTKEDILNARNRHPYWRKKKMAGSAERTRKRLEAHDYSGGVDVEWTRERIEEFLVLNVKGANGRYVTKDWQIAERFGASIPSIQYMRRKCRKVEGILGTKASRAKLIDYLSRAESVLDRGAEAVENLAIAERERAKAQAKKEKGETAVAAPRQPKAAKPAKATRPKAAPRPEAAPKSADRAKAKKKLPSPNPDVEKQRDT